MFFRVFIVISLLEREGTWSSQNESIRRVFTLTGDQAKVKETSLDGQSNDQWSWGPKCTVFILLSSLCFRFFRFFIFSAVLMLLIKISVVRACSEVAQVSCPLFLRFKEHIKTKMLSNFPFGMYLPFLAWPTLSRVIDDNCRTLNWFNVFFSN